MTLPDPGQQQPATPTPGHPLPPPAAKKGLSTTKLLLLVGGGLLALCCVGGIIVAVAGGSGKKTAGPANPTTALPGATTATTPAAPATTEAAPPPPAPPAGPKTTIDGDGIFLVGTDIVPGQYRTKVPADSVNCYWQRSKDTTGSFQSIISNGNSGPNTPVVVTIASTDKAFKAQGCGTWAKVG
jgi:hypothetical protein